MAATIYILVGVVIGFILAELKQNVKVEDLQDDEKYEIVRAIDDRIQKLHQHRVQQKWSVGYTTDENLKTLSRVRHLFSNIKWWQ